MCRDIEECLELTVLVPDHADQPSETRGFIGGGSRTGEHLL
jgi:hypothetical protein